MNTVSRRSFLQTSGIGTGLLIVSSQTAFTAEKNSALNVGLIGCGGRGNHDLGNIRKVGNVHAAALADPFQDRLEAIARRLEDDSPKLHQGMDAYRELLQNDEIDAVIITSPPYFHPEHFDAAVGAGKHIYMEKPVSVDAAGAQRVLQTGRKGDGKVSMMIGFQMRFDPTLREAARRIHEGAIGEIACGDGFYHSGKLTPQSKPGMPEKEAYLRNWLFSKTLSGDILVEQNIHILDVCNWFLNAHPLQAFGTGGRKIRTSVGDTWDHYELIFEYPNEVNLPFYSTQFLDLGWGDMGERFNGSKGAFDGHKSPISIRGENPWTPSEGGDEGVLQAGNSEERKMKAFYDSIVNRQLVNEVAQGVESTLTAILGRIAAYKGQIVTWDEMIKENEELKADL